MRYLPLHDIEGFKWNPIRERYIVTWCSKCNDNRHHTLVDVVTDPETMNVTGFLFNCTACMEGIT